jgi:eukaryotic-like serine/threonine-protein kinase
MAGESFGRYRVEARLGAGGMGTVYRAWDPELQRPVAIKVLEPRPGDTKDASRAELLREARAASALNHPNICTVYEVREEGSTAFIVMDFVEGRQRAQMIPQGCRLKPSSGTERRSPRRSRTRTIEASSIGI